MKKYEIKTKISAKACSKKIDSVSYFSKCTETIYPNIWDKALVTVGSIGLLSIISKDGYCMTLL